MCFGAGEVYNKKKKAGVKMKLKLFRHATMLLSYAGKTILTDPLLAGVAEMPAIDNSPRPRPNPLVALPDAEMIGLAEAVLLTHCHRDHFDQQAKEKLCKTLPLFCQPSDCETLREADFKNVLPVQDEIIWQGIRIRRTPGRHGHGETAKAMGCSSGYLLEAAGEEKIYITGDTVWYEEVAAVLEKERPGIIIAYAGAATFLQDRPITLDETDMQKLFAAAPWAKVVAVHMEAFNHCLLERAALRRVIADPRLYIPQDGESIVF